LTILTFLAAVFIFSGVYSVIYDVFLRNRARVTQRLDEEFVKGQRAKIQKSPVFKDLGKLSAEARADSKLDSGFSEWFQTIVEQSGLDLSVQRLLAIMGGAGAVMGPLCWLLSRSWVAGVIGSVAGVAVPFLYVYIKRNRRQDKLLSQLPDAFELIARLIRAGQTISQSFQGVADEFQAPIATEFAVCYEQQNLGLSPDVALRDLGRRVGLVEMKIFTLGVLVQKQSGGNLAELIDNLASIVRERFRIRGKIRVLTAEGRMEAAVLLALPPVVFGLILALNKTYALLLFEHPNVIWGMLGLMFVGFLWIRRIINFDF
jgi:tight adherence protein B